jgi:gamma-glutamylcyclotransferase (GGCT)/AIG2-like uncharacterized protein YtfP
MKTFYLAYGMNTNVQQMAWRCPKARSLGKVTLDKHRLAFKNFCDIIKDPIASMECVLWEITPECEQALDRLEGYPTFYGKKEVDVKFKGRKIRAMIYYMTDEHYATGFPSEHYLKMVSEGYVEHDIGTEQIIKALEEVEDAYCYGN